MKYLLPLVFLTYSFAGFGQIKERIILIGDAGEINASQQAVIAHAAQQVQKEHTHVFYLGDNIYPDGMPLTGETEIRAAQDILKSQYEPMLAQGASVFFMAGNHDWNYSKKDGLARMLAQSDFLNKQQNPKLQYLPKEGCPDPVAVEISDKAVVIVYDSEWFLYRYTRNQDNDSCDCRTPMEVFEKLDELLYTHKDKLVILAGHHPMHSYSVHGGYYTLRDHLFPLTNLSSKLFIPLPVVGSLYPLFRNTVFLNAEDKAHPSYSFLFENIMKLTENHPNLVFASGHDHGVQYIKKEKATQIVSGGASKSNSVYPGKDLLFSYSKGGYAIIDVLEDGAREVQFFTFKDGEVALAYTDKVPFITPVKTILEQEIASQDSVVTTLHPAYAEVSQLHRFFLGDNYRAEYAMPTRLPVFRSHILMGGLRPTQRGGGMQSLSLRLEDKDEKEYVFRTVMKRTDALIPAPLHNTFVEFILDDANSGQNPYGALVVPPIAAAVKVAHTKPIIGVVAPDTALAGYNGTFADEVVLFEEREPLGDSDNTPKMLAKLQKDNDDSFDAKAWLRARILDVYIADWDRHEDQWRWRDVNEGTNKDRYYIPVPRDRDQALRYSQGILSTLVYQPIFQPTMQTFTPHIGNVNFALFKSTFLNAHPAFQFSHDEWMKEATDFQAAVTEEVIDSALAGLPAEVQAIRNKAFKEAFLARREQLPEAMDKHYRFINNIVDIHLSDKNEKVTVEDAGKNASKITVRKINKDGEVKRKLMEKTYDPAVTKEIRLYVAKGDDSVFINTANSRIKLRVIGGEGKKYYHVAAAASPVKLYDLGLSSKIEGQDYKLIQKQDSAHVAFVPVNLYNYWAPVFDFRYNTDDGVMLGLGLKYTHNRGFRKSPYTYEQSFWALGSFNTGAVRLNYLGDWKNVVGNADFNLEARAYIPQNSQNFFGLGNATTKDPVAERAFYRARFNLYDLEPSLKWKIDAQSSLKIGPALQYYHMNTNNNKDRFILSGSALNTYDSTTVDKDKLFIGFTGKFRRDNRDNPILSTRGGYFEAEVLGYQGLNRYSKAYVQAKAELGLNFGIANNAIIIANRIGGGMTFGKPAFYQSLFIGGHGNLRGYRGYRFAGEHSLYNNLEARIRILDIANYILPGQLGAVALYDVGKVWAKGYNSKTWHQGYGGGLYFSPAKMFVVQYVWAKSREGWQPYLSTGFRF